MRAASVAQMRLALSVTESNMAAQPSKEPKTMRISLLPLSVCLALGAAGAYADSSYQAGIDGCEGAIAKRIGVEPTALTTHLAKIRSSGHYRDLQFNVASPGAAQQLSFACRVKMNGEVISLDTDEGALAAAVARQ